MKMGNHNTKRKKSDVMLNGGRLSACNCTTTVLMCYVKNDW